MRILLLGLSFIAIVSFSSCEKRASQKDSSYNCISGSCEEAEDGDYASYDECQSSCTSNSLYYEGNGVSDVDGNTYKTVVYGNGQEWMAENLRTSSYRNGDEILYIEDDFDWGHKDGLVRKQEVGAWCYMENDPSYDIPHGKLYNGHVATDPRGLCPQGWHIPSEREWVEFFEFLGGVNNDTAGKKLKSVSGWIDDGTSDGNGTNESGFNAFPSGFRAQYRYDFDESFGGFGNSTSWLSSDHSGTFQYSAAQLTNARSVALQIVSYYYAAGVSCRCLKD